MSRHDHEGQPEEACPDDVRLADYESGRLRPAERGTPAERPALPTLRQDQQLGDFTLLRELGRGAMGIVWEAEQTTLQRKIALKVLHPQYNFSEDFIHRFQREARAAARLNHAGIVSVYEVGEVDGIHYIAQELVPRGLTLKEALHDIERRSIEPSDYCRHVASLFSQIADALQLAHDRGVIHRDVKPSNILISDEGQPKVGDFGLAKLAEDPALSNTGDLEGTPLYMSPEQSMAKRVPIDHRTDIFSLGTSLYEALARQRPFQGDTRAAILQQILWFDPPSPRKLHSDVPRDLATICLKAMGKPPHRRYQTMAAFSADLQSFLAGEPVRARPPGFFYRLSKLSRRYPLQAGALACLALLVLIARWAFGEEVAALLPRWLEAVGLTTLLKPVAGVPGLKRLAKAIIKLLIGTAAIVSILALLRWWRRGPRRRQRP